MGKILKWEKLISNFYKQIIYIHTNLEENVSISYLWMVVYQHNFSTMKTYF